MSQLGEADCDPVEDSPKSIRSASSISPRILRSSALLSCGSRDILRLCAVFSMSCCSSLNCLCGKYCSNLVARPGQRKMANVGNTTNTEIPVCRESYPQGNTVTRIMTAQTI